MKHTNSNFPLSIFNVEKLSLGKTSFYQGNAPRNEPFFCRDIIIETDREIFKIGLYSYLDEAALQLREEASPKEETSK